MQNEKQWEMLSKAIQIAANQHDGQFDKAGMPYILHCIHVMEEVRKRVSDDPYILQAAVLHDLIEDTEWEISDLTIAGFSEPVLNTLQLLTHHRHLSYEEYIDRMLIDYEAMVIKLADLRHNMDLTRLPEITERDEKRREKYEWAEKKIEKQLEAIASVTSQWEQRLNTK